MSADPLVWIVDDDPAEHAMFGRAFKKLHLELEGFFSAEDALDRMQRGGRPSLILLDLRMPGIGGLSFLEHRRSLGFDDFPIVVLTSSSNPSDIEEAYRRGANAYLQKPTDYEALKQFVEVVFSFWFQWAHLPRRDVLDSE